MIEFFVASVVERMVRPGVLVATDVSTSNDDRAVDAAIAATEQAMRTWGDPGQIVQAVRAMFRQFGVDPTKTRPSSEALLRRIRRGESLPRIDAVVDIGNWCSLETQLPYGLYDLDRIQGAVDLRLGAEGEEYAGIRKDVVHVAGRLLVADAVGPFGNPSSDSARTSVSSATRRVLVVIYAPATLPASVIDAAVRLTSERLKRYLGAEAVERVR